MLYFSVLQFSFDSFFITFFFAETFFMCFRIICNWLLKSFYASSVQFSHSLVSDSLWPPWTAAWQDSLSITKSWSLLKLLSIKLVMPSNHLILYCPLLLLSSIFPSIRVFSSESALCIRWPQYWSFSFNISPSNEYSGLISFRIDWFDLLAVQKSLEPYPTPVFKSINSLVLNFSLWSNSFIHDYWKNHSLTIQTFVGNVSAF